IWGFMLQKQPEEVLCTPHRLSLTCWLTLLVAALGGVNLASRTVSQNFLLCSFPVRTSPRGNLFARFGGQKRSSSHVRLLVTISKSPLLYNLCSLNPQEN
ncbi:unnamed protein product, partial [Rangifer tarandus platyrhynchus]